MGVNMIIAGGCGSKRGGVTFALAFDWWCLAIMKESTPKAELLIEEIPGKVRG